MNRHLLFLIASLGVLTSCATSRNPLDDPNLRLPKVSPGPGMTVKFLGNTNLLISDGKTNLLVDGFFTRPNGLQTLIGVLEPDAKIIADELRDAGITRLDAILVGHAHHDHALDTPEVARQRKHPLVVGSASYAMIHKGQNGLMDGRHLQVIPQEGGRYRFGQFWVHFTPSDHVSSHSPVQSWVEGNIEQPLKVPAHYSRFKCGQVYAIHIRHDVHGSIGVTTTAGATTNQWAGRRADVIFLGVGMLSEETPEDRDHYWQHTVGALKPRLVVPVHWDDFAKPLKKRLQPAPRLAYDLDATFDWVKDKARQEKRDVRVLDHRESLRLLHGRIVQ